MRARKGGHLLGVVLEVESWWEVNRPDVMVSLGMEVWSVVQELIVIRKAETTQLFVRVKAGAALRRDFQPSP